MFKPYYFRNIFLVLFIAKMKINLLGGAERMWLNKTENNK